MISSRRNRRKGNVLALTAFMMIAMLALLAFAVDVGYVYTVRSQLQRSADAAAIAATWDLIDEEAIIAGDDMDSAATTARLTAAEFAGFNTVSAKSPGLDDSDVVVGYMANPSDPECQLDPNDSRKNAVRVRVRRTVDQNGSVPLFFASVLGQSNLQIEAQATAAVLSNFSGFQTPSGGNPNLGILPFALDKQTWDAMIAGGGNDQWTWDAENGTITAGGDGIREVNLYPQGTGSPGNRGTVDIGSSNNSTADIARQIVHGISPQDMEHHGGKLEFDENGELELNGDTGISAGVKDELASIKGQPRVIPVFTTVVGPGNNAQFTIVEWVGIRIMDVKLTGSMSSKRVIIQPAVVKLPGGIPSTSDTPQSTFVYSPVWLVR
jgi:Flp pilus assembly protein TadG